MPLYSRRKGVVDTIPLLPLALFSLLFVNAKTNLLLLRVRNVPCRQGLSNYHSIGCQCYYYNSVRSHGQMSQLQLMNGEKQSGETEPLLGQVNIQSYDDEFADNPPPESTVTTGQKILDLAIPAAGALLIDPLMTLVDTAFVGRFTTTTSLSGGESLATTAAPLSGMGSAAALLTFTFYLFNFLCTTTTPLVALKRSSGNEKEAITLGGQVLSLSFILGFTLTILLLLGRQPLLLLMGTGNTGIEANSYAIDFLTIRAFAAPAVLCMEASTGVLRGYLDTKTPIYVLFLANTINLILDILLIVILGMGPKGAAIATTTSEWISACLFLAILAGKVPAAEYLGKIEKSVSSIVPVWDIPSWREIQPLFVASSSTFFRALVLQASLASAAAMAARSGNDSVDVVAAASVAAHQIGIQLWLLCSFFCDSLAAASQGLIADALGRQDSDDVIDISKTILLYSLCLGLSLALLLQIGTWTSLLLDLFTQNEATRAALISILPLIVLAQPLNALVFAADGVIQGASEFPFQAKAMAVSGMTAVGTFVLLEALNPSDASTLVHVWSALLALQLMRGLTSLWKIIDRNGPINLLSRKET
jgi:putative MATE family efflux protein